MQTQLGESKRVPKFRGGKIVAADRELYAYLIKYSDWPEDYKTMRVAKRAIRLDLSINCRSNHSIYAGLFNKYTEGGPAVGVVACGRTVNALPSYKELQKFKPNVQFGALGQQFTPTDFEALKKIDVEKNPETRFSELVKLYRLVLQRHLDGLFPKEGEGIFRLDWFNDNMISRLRNDRCQGFFYLKRREDGRNVLYWTDRDSSNGSAVAVPISQLEAKLTELARELEFDAESSAGPDMIKSYFKAIIAHAARLKRIGTKNIIIELKPKFEEKGRIELFRHFPLFELSGQRQQAVVYFGEPLAESEPNYGFSIISDPKNAIMITNFPIEHELKNGRRE